MQARVARMLAPLVGGVLGALAGAPAAEDDGGKGKPALRVEDVASALQGFQGMSPEAFAALAYDLLAHTTVNGMPAQQKFDEQYAGNYLELYKALGWIIDFNFGNVFGAGGIGGLIALLKAKTSALKSGSLLKS